jgi:hypothetical protein
LQAQHWTLSGLADVGLQTNPAKARSSALGAANGQAALALGAAFFDRELVRLVLVAPAAPKVASRAWYVAKDASILVSSEGYNDFWTGADVNCIAVSRIQCITTSLIVFGCCSGGCRVFWREGAA